MLCLDLTLLKNNVGSIIANQPKLILSCNYVVLFCEPDSNLDGNSKCHFGSRLVGALRIAKRRPSLARSSRRFFPSWRDLQNSIDFH